jgi:zinc protease
MTSMIRFAAAVALLLSPIQVLAAAPIQRVVSPGGIEAWLVEEHAIPMVALEISFDGGASLDPVGREGLANFLAAMLDEGAGDLDAVAFAEARQTTGMRLSFNAGRESLSVSARMLSGTLDDSLALLRTALMAPRFDEEPLRRVRGQILSSLRSDEADPDSLARNAWFAAAFPGDAYGRNSDGTLASVAAIGPEDLRAAQGRVMTRTRMKVGVVGAIDAATLGPLLDELLGGLPEGEPRSVAPVTMAAAGGVTVVPFDAPQSTVIFGHAGPMRDDPDFMAAFVLNHIIGGGGFASILMEEVREKRGLAYGAYSYLSTLDRAGLWIGGTGTANERVAESLAVIREQWARVATEGVTADQLDRAKRYLTGAYPLRFDSNGAIAGILVGLQRDGFPIDYPERRNALVEAVTLEDVQRVAARWLKPEALFFVVVGQPQGVAVQ